MNINYFLKVFLALFIGLCGSLVFIYLHIPLPWLLGAVFITSIAVRFERIPLLAPKIFSSFARILVGLTLGSAFSPEILKYLSHYIFSLLLVIPFTLLTIICGTYYYHKLLKYDIKTSFLGSMPGGVIEMAIIGQDLKANTSKITLMQGSRLFFVIISLPFIIQNLFHIDVRGNKIITTSIVNVDLYQLGILIILGLIAGIIAKKIRIAAAYLIGPMIISIFVHSTGYINVHMPDEFLKFVQVVFGTIIGFTFKDVQLKDILKTFASTLGHFIILIIICLFFIFIIHTFSNFKVLDIFLSFAPGGQNEINLIAILVGANLPYVALHHIVRLLIVMNIAPFVSKRLKDT